MTPRDLRPIVAAKRDGRTLSGDDMAEFVTAAFARGEVGEGLGSAFLMACTIRGLDDDEVLAMTRAMVNSGKTLKFAASDRPTVDKHSTGGVADGVTLVFAPLAAALGLRVVKLSGRGLGHTGGTIDKLESIPGFRADLDSSEIVRQADDVGCVIATQSAALVPADRAMYALRDATATVPSIPLISASVMSKKLAVTSDLIVLDVTCGSGAFMKELAAARELERTCRTVADAWGRACCSAVTDMSQPLGDAIGNALDVAEAIAVLRGEKHGRLRDLALWFAATALAAASGVTSDAARTDVERRLNDGSALEAFRRMVAAQDGDPSVVDDPASVLPRAPVVSPIPMERDGKLAAMDAEEVGRASVALGAGRIRKDDRIDPAVGIVMHAKIGDGLERGVSIGEVHARSGDAAAEAASRVVRALTISEGSVDPPPLIYGSLVREGEDGRLLG